MQKPVFLSVGGYEDACFAKEVHNLLGDSLAYHYQITGEETVEFKSEILAQLNGCQVFVAFWSNNYLSSEHACNELAYFRKLTESDVNSQKQLIVVPCKPEHPDIQSKWKNPITQKQDEFILGRWRNDRAIDAGSDALRVAQLIKRRLEQLKVLSIRLIPRGWLTDLFKREIAQPDYLARELVFVTGLEGVGRRTALRQYMLQTHPHRVERAVSLDSIDGPEDLLIHLMEAASCPATERTATLDAIAKNSTTVVKEARKILHQSRDNKSYYVVAIDRFVGVDGVSIPNWLSELMSVFKVGGAPLVFVVTSSPVTDTLLAHYPNSSRIRVPGLEEEEVKELVHHLAMEDPTPIRWSASKKQAVVEAAGGSPSMCKSIMRSMSVEPTLDFVDEIAKRAVDSFGEALAGLMAHWARYYANKRSDLFALRVIDKLGVASKEALDEIMQPVVEKSGPFDLYTLRDQGLVEQLSDGIYRVPPLVQRRLSYALWGTINTAEVDKLFIGFSKKVLVSKSEYGAIYATNAATASIRSGAKNIAPEYARYLTIATLFKSGIERYSSKEWGLAHHTLQRAMTRLASNPLIDLTTQLEIARYSGLAAARNFDKKAVSAACSFLENNLSHTKRAQSAGAMAKFIRGFQFRLSENYDPAVYEFKGALQQLADERFVERQRAAVYTELAATYLRTKPPQFDKALDMAKAAYDQKDVTHTLSAYIHAMVLYVFRSGRFTSEEAVEDHIAELNALLARLQLRSAESGQSFYSDRYAEFQRELNSWKLAISQPSGARSFANSSEKTSYSPIELEFL